MESKFQRRSSAFRRLRLTNQTQATTICEAAGLQPDTNPQLVPTNLTTNKIEKFFTIRGVADLLAVCERTVRRWDGGKKIRAHKFGGVTRISEHDLCAFIASARRAGTPLIKPTDEKFCTVEDVAEILNVCERTVRRWIGREELVAHDLEGLIRIAESDLTAFIARHRGA